MRDEKNKRFGKALLALTLAFVLLLTSVAGAVEVFAEEGLKTIDFAKGIVVEKPEPKAPITEDAKAKDEKASPVIENDAEEEKAELDLGGEIAGEAVGAAVKAPKIDNVFIGDKTISGSNLAKDRVNKQIVIATVHVTLKGEDGTVKATLSVTPTSGTKWSVTLPDGKKVEKGDTVTVYQQIGEDKSPEVTANAQPSKASTVTLTMPTGEIWIEQTSSNQVNEDEQAEAIEMLKKANPDIVNDIDFGPKKTKFSIDGTDHAYYEVTYTDGSTAGQIEATNLKIKQVTEHSRGATLGSITIVDNVIKGQLSGEGPFDGIKVQIILKVSEADKPNFCDGGKCTVDKDSSKPVDATVNGTTGEFTYTLNSTDKIELGQFIGVTVKEKNKFKSCKYTTAISPTPEKTEVRDPRKLTPEDKKTIDAAIRKAYTVNGESKLPDGTGDWEEVPAVIKIDDNGNVKIFSGNDAAGTWDSEGTFVPETDADGSVKVNKGAEPTITIQGKDLLLNKAPEKPALKVDGGNVIITPDKVDTDAKIITVSYKDKDGKDQTTTATKDDNGTWSIVGEGTVIDGVISLPKNKVKGGTDVTATVTDKGGIADDDTTPLTSDQGSLTVKETKADKVEALGGLDPVELKKWVGDTVDWKKGVKAKDDAKKDEVEKLLKGATFEDVTEKKRSTSNEGDFEGKIKVTFDDGSFIEVEKQMLYVSNDVTSTKREDKVPTDALDVEFKLGEGTKVDNTDGTAITGDKENPTSYQSYKVKPKTNVKEYTLPIINASVIDSIKVTPQKGYTEPVWRDSKNGTDFVATTKNNVFTATATKTYDITFDANTGGGTKDKVTQKVNTEYELPAANTFTAPDENHVFSGWQIGDDSINLKQPGAKIKITGDTVVKAIWKPIELKVNFLPGTGASGEMKDVPVNKGSDYKLPEPTFTAPKNQKFAGWKVGNEDGVKEAGETIKITDNVTLTATWKDIMVKVSYNANGGSGKMEGKELKKGSTYKLPANGFTAPENQEFKAWQVDGKEVAAGTVITVDKDTEVKAVWKPIMVDVSFDKGEGSGSKDKVSVAKGSEYTLPNSDGFTAPAGKEFAGWQVGNDTKKPGDTIKVDANTVVKALWKEKPQNKEERPMFFYFKPTTKPVLNLKDHSQYMIGYKDGTFRPNNKMSRQEVTVMLSRLLSERPQKGMIYSRDYKDVADNLWSVTAISYMSNLKMVKGYPDGNFRPYANITRAEFAAMVVRFENISAAGSKEFTDLQKDHWAYEVIQKAAQAGWISGYPDGSFRPDQPITRAEVVAITNRMLNRFADEDFVDHNLNKIINFTDIDKSHWAYYPVVEATNGHGYERKANGKDETWFEVTGSTFVYDK